MTRHLTIKFLVFLFCSSISAKASLSLPAPGIHAVPNTFPGSHIFPYLNTTDCKFPFNYQDNTYMDCTIDGDNGDVPWCSLTTDYQGLITYCTDVRYTTLKCLPSFTMPNGKVYTTCDYLSTSAKYKQCKSNDLTIKYRYCTNATESPYLTSVQRHANCDPNYAKLSQDHSMCYGPSQYAIPVPLTATEIQGVLDIHNSYRANVSSRYMFQLYWDDELTKLAQVHSNMCAFEHDLAVNRGSPLYPWLMGQNMVMSSEIVSSPASLIDMMLGSEQPNFVYGQGCYPGDNTCLHYTQAMISNLTRVGCGQTHCVYPDRIERYVTCNYIQSQYEDTYMTPYVSSTIPCVDCPAKKKNGLCDCGNKICRYDQNEYLEPATCLCKTPPSGKRSIDKRDAVEDELNNYAGEGNVLIRHGHKPPGSKSKRDIVEDELNNYAGEGNVLIRHGHKPPGSKSKRETRVIGQIETSKRGFSVAHKPGHKQKNNKK